MLNAITRTVRRVLDVPPVIDLDDTRLTRTLAAATQDRAARTAVALAQAEHERVLADREARAAALRGDCGRG